MDSNNLHPAPMEQLSPEWHEFRRHHIGSSDIAIIMCVSPWKTPYKLWLEKIHNVEGYETPSMAYGKRMESDVLYSYVEKFGEEMLPTGRPLVYKDWEIASASLDGINFDGTKICEIKCPNKTVIELARENIIPDYYAMQIQWELMVSGAKSCDYVVYDYMKEDIIIVNVTPNKCLQEEMLIQAKEFWKYVELVKEPKKTIRDLNDVNSPEFLTLAEEYRELSEKIKEMEDQKDILKKQLIGLADGSPAIGGGIKITFSKGRTSVNMEKLKEAYNITDIEKFQKESKGFWVINIL